jgi:cytochrome P450
MQIQLFQLHNYKSDLIVSQDTNPTEQKFRAAATRFSANRVRERFSDACKIFHKLIKTTAQYGQPLKESVVSALFEHSNKVLFDYEPSVFTSMDIAELIDFINFENLDGIGILQICFPSSYKLPLQRNKRRNAIIERFAPLFEDILEQQKALAKQGQDCILRATLEKLDDEEKRKIEEDDDYLKSFFWGLYTASFLTSITTSCAVLHHLAKQTDAQEVIAREVKAVFPTDMKDLTHGHLMKLVDTRSFVKEVMRSFSPAPSVGRRIGKVNVNLSLKTLNDSPDLWDEPKKLVYNRFVEKSRLNEHREKFFTFGLGRRSCPGQEYVQFEFVLIVALFVREYKISHEDPDTKLHLSYLGSIPTITNPSDLVFDFFPRAIHMNRRAGLMRQKSSARFITQDETPRRFSSVARLSGFLIGTIEDEITES